MRRLVAFRIAMLNRLTGTGNGVTDPGAACAGVYVINHFSSQLVPAYWNVTVAMARLTLSCGQNVMSPGGCARPGDIGALAGSVQDPRARRVRHAYGPPEGTRRVPDRRSARPRIPSHGCPLSRQASSHLRRNASPSTLGRKKPEGADHSEPDRSASCSRVEDVPIERQFRVLAERQTRIIFEGDL